MSPASLIALTSVLLSPLAVGAAPGSDVRLPSVPEAIFDSHCYACHDEDVQKGDVRLDDLADLPLADRLNLLNRVQEQVYFQHMPPKKKAQPSPEEREALFDWVSSALDQHDASRLKHKLLDPHYGNYVDHDKLFSGEIKDAPFSPARLWRRNPHHFDVAKRTYFGVHPNPEKTIGEVDKLKQPFNKGSAEGISDFAALFYADSATFDTLYRNAAFVVDRTLLLAFIEYDYQSRGKTLDDWRADRAEVLKAQQKEIERYQREGKTTRYISGAHRALNAKYTLETPEVYRDIILGNGEPTRTQMEAAIRHHFERSGQGEPTPKDLEKYTQFLRDGIAESGPYFGLRNVLIAILVSPDYIYRSELGHGRPGSEGRTMLAPAELAYAISYALTDEKPDAILLEAVRSGRLQTRENVRREVVRLLEDGSIEKPRILRFFHEFFGYHHAPEVFKDDERIFGGFTFHKIARSYVEDTDTLVRHLLKEDKDVFRRLLATEEYFVGHNGDNAAVRAEVEAHQKLYAYFKDKNWKNYAEKAQEKEAPTEVDLEYAQSLHPDFRSTNGKLKSGEAIFAKMRSLESFEKKGITPFTYSLRRPRDSQFKGLLAYNISGYDWDFPVEQPFVLAKGKRAGILSHPSWLIAHSQNATTDPVKRGKWIRERLLAGTVPELPITVDASIPDDPHQTLRERFAVTEAEACWKCHVKMNPLGYPFEVFDDFGRWRDEELMEGLPKKGKEYETRPINSLGWLDGTGDEQLDGEVENAYDMIQRLSRSRRVQQSFIRHAFRYWMGRNEFLTDSRTLIDAENAYIESDGSFNAMLISLLTSDSFIYRKHLD